MVAQNMLRTYKVFQKKTKVQLAANLAFLKENGFQKNSVDF